ncbi:MAG TPA: cytochrome C [Blastocatellia bacterium]|nr:cytochrome C [Blastocatellia bacterium]
MDKKTRVKLLFLASFIASSVLLCSNPPMSVSGFGGQDSISKGAAARTTNKGGNAAGRATAGSDAPGPQRDAASGPRNHDYQMRQDGSRQAGPDAESRYPQYQEVGSDLKPYPVLKPGDITPTDLYRYGGAGKTSYASISDVGDFDEFYSRLSAQKPKVMARWSSYMQQRYDFTGKTDPSATMTRGKHIPVGPVVRLPEGINSWEDYDKLTPSEILARDLFPEGFRPLSHPLQSTGHMLFPPMWLREHPEDTRFDVDFDIPEAYLPEFPPPLFLTTRPDLGDVSQGCEITEKNFHTLFDGILTPEQLKGLEKLVSKSNSSWFNQTKHRLTKEPSAGIACFDCHVNGHTNGAIEMDPGARPTLARVRLDTPSLRGNNVNLLFSLKRSIRSVDHFAEVEEYFDGDIGLQQQIGGREFNKQTTNVMGDFNSIIGFPPAPKLNRFGRLDPTKATESELRGEKLFFGKASCSECHAPPYYIDNQMHDLRVEEFYRGRAEGWAKTFSLRGIKDSPPYFHDGRLPTLEDTVEFFNLVFQLKLVRDEKKDLVAFLKCL